MHTYVLLFCAYICVLFGAYLCGFIFVYTHELLFGAHVLLFYVYICASVLCAHGCFRFVHTYVLLFCACTGASVFSIRKRFCVVYVCFLKGGRKTGH